MGDIVLNMGVKFREVGIVPNAHMTLISEARIQQAGYGINKPPGKQTAQIYIEGEKNGKYQKTIIMEFTKDKSTDLWVFNMTEAHQSPQERYLEQSGMIRFKPKSRTIVEDEEEEKKEQDDTSSTRRHIPRKQAQQKGGSTLTVQKSTALAPLPQSSLLPKNKRKRK